MACPPNSGERVLVQAGIQLANAGLKARMGRDAAKIRLMQQADELFAEAGLRKVVHPEMLDWVRMHRQIYAL